MNLELRKKYSFRVGDRKVVLIKKAYESEFHPPTPGHYGFMRGGN